MKSRVRAGPIEEFVMNRPYKILIADDEKPVAAGLQGQLDRRSATTSSPSSTMGITRSKSAADRSRTWC